MWQRLSLYDIRVIGHYLGSLTLISTFGLLVPLVTAVIFGEWNAASRYFLTAGIFLIAGSALRFLRVQPGRLSRQQAFAVTGFAWLVLALFAALPLAWSGHYANYLDALFDYYKDLYVTGDVKTLSACEPDAAHIEEIAGKSTLPGVLEKDEIVKMINDLRAGGVDVMFDIYDETLGVSVITVILPDWYRSMSPDEKKKPFTRLKLAALVKASSLLLGFGFKDIQIAYIGPGQEK